MRPTLLLLAPVVGLVLATPGVPAYADVVAPSPGTHTFKTFDALVPVVDGPDGKHPAMIDTTLYVPNGNATPQPAILQTNGFGLSKSAAEIVSQATFLARHGYVVLAYTAQGFGHSSGCVTLQSRTYDVKDAQQLITKLLGPRADVLHDSHGPVVGMVGGSYGGGIQANVAENDPRIHAIAPGRTWNTLQYSLDPNNRIVPGDPTGFSHEKNTQGVFKAEWTSLFFISGNMNPASGAGMCPQDKAASGDPTKIAGVACPGFFLEVCQTYGRISATGDATEQDKALLADSSATTQIDKLTVPTTLVQGQSDTLFNTNDAVSTYLSLRRRGVPVQMIWNSGGHGGYDSLPGECEVYGSGTGGADFRGLDDCYLTLRTLHFLDHYLRGTPDPSPGFTYFRDWVPYGGSGADDEQYGQAAQFPAGPATTYRLSGTSALTTGATAPGTATFLTPPGRHAVGVHRDLELHWATELPPGAAAAERAARPARRLHDRALPERAGQRRRAVRAPDAEAHRHDRPGLVRQGVRRRRRRDRDADPPADRAGTGAGRGGRPAGRPEAAGLRPPVRQGPPRAAHPGRDRHHLLQRKAPDAITVTSTGSTFTLPGQVMPARVRSQAPVAAAAPAAPAAEPAAAAPATSAARLPATGLDAGLPAAALALLAGAVLVARRCRV